MAPLAMKKLVLIPIAKWDAMVRQYNIDVTGDIQDLAIPIPNLDDKRAPLPPPTPVDALDDDAVDKKKQKHEPPGGGDAPASPAAATPRAPTPPGPPGEEEGGKGEEGGAWEPPVFFRAGGNKRPPSGMAFKCSDGTSPNLVKVAKKNKKKKGGGGRMKTDFVGGENLKTLRQKQKESNNKDVFDKSQPVDKEQQWKSLRQSSIDKALSLRKQGRKTMEEIEALKSRMQNRHAKARKKLPPQ